VTPTTASKKPLVADLRFAQEAPTAEIRTTADAVEVCFFHPSLDLADAEVTVTPYTFRIRRRGDERLLVYALPVAAEPGRFVTRARNGVYTVLIARAARSR